MQNPAIKNNGSNRFKFGLRYEDKEVRQLNFNCLTSFVFKQVANCRQIFCYVFRPQLLVAQNPELHTNCEITWIFKCVSPHLKKLYNFARL